MRILELFIGLLIFCNLCKAQIYSPAKWSYSAKKISGSEAVIYLKATIEEGWHIYSVNQKPGGPLKTTFSFSPSRDFILNGPTKEPMPISKFNETFGIQVSYFENEVVFQQSIKLKKPRPIIKGRVEFMACTDERCLSPEELGFSISVK
ncbi:protein-disulfide reductase DsbD domain-containing protein [Pedobacter africanus]|uniref:Disulphide bond corrector protein DsbC n=1 Tax=Pedobacter africanus TaxID=151894 RepID=A0A1W2A1W2_9SPHI|nr:protein-disulfide reductase DsbD domain-containing protein [Pedobacter africanus]SMC54630.1 Disulphide bond corrector protein DsbC [Pedobacter africanus]